MDRAKKFLCDKIVEIWEKEMPGLSRADQLPLFNNPEYKIILPGISRLRVSDTAAYAFDRSVKGVGAAYRQMLRHARKGELRGYGTDGQCELLVDYKEQGQVAWMITLVG